MKLMTKYKTEQQLKGIIELWEEDRTAAKIKLINYLVFIDDKEAADYIFENLYYNHNKIYEDCYQLILEYNTNGLQNILEFSNNNEQEECEEYKNCEDSFDDFEDNEDDEFDKLFKEMSLLQVIGLTVKCWFSYRMRIK